MVEDLTLINNRSWKGISAKEKFQIINGTSLVAAAIILYFVAFILTLSIGFEIISAGATLLASGLAFFGLNSFVKNQMIEFEAKVDKKIKDLDNYKRKEDDEE